MYERNQKVLSNDLKKNTIEKESESNKLIE